MALTADRAETIERTSVDFEGPMAASAECFVGAILVRDASGNIEPGTAAASKIAVGRCEEYALESTGVAAASNVKYKAGCFKWKNSATDAVTKANIGDTVYIEDDETICATGTGKSAAGIMVDIESDGVWVMIGASVFSTIGLLAANNLSDVGSAATAAENIGVGVTDSPTFAGVTVTGAAALNGGITCDTDKFTVADTTGNTAIAGTLDVTGASTFTAATEHQGGAAFLSSGTAVRKTAKKTLSNAEIKGMRASPVALIAAPGAGKLCVVETVILSLNAGSEVLTESADNMVVQYNNSGQDITGAIEATGFIDQAADTTAIYYGAAIAAMAEATVGVNEAVEIFNTGDGEYAGNASNDATMDVVVAYWEVTL